jgi:hypothetical protein
MSQSRVTRALAFLLFQTRQELFYGPIRGRNGIETYLNTKMGRNEALDAANAAYGLIFGGSKWLTH